MTDPGTIRKLARQRLKEATILFEQGMFDGAFYLAGYAVELTLKARVAEKLGIPELFDDSNTIVLHGLSEIRQVVKTHNLMTLLILSGLKPKFDLDKATNWQLLTAGSLLFNTWNEKVRYKPCGHCHPKDIEKLINLLSHQDGILTWIEQN